jgi:hypothetical protein
MLQHLTSSLRLVNNSFKSNRRTTNNNKRERQQGQQQQKQQQLIIMDVDDDNTRSMSMMTERESDSSSQMFANMNSQDSRGRKGVQFKSRESIEDVRRISRISQRNLDEVLAYWGTTEEHKLRKQELRHAAHEMQVNRRLSDNMEFTTLGLADKVGEGKALKKAQRAKSREAVLDEQELQFHEGIVDDDLLASVYQSVACGAQKDARTKAEMLHDEVQKF